MIMDVVMNVPTDSVAAAGVASGTSGFVCRFQNNVSCKTNIFRFKLSFNVFVFFMEVQFLKI